MKTSAARHRGWMVLAGCWALGCGAETTSSAADASAARDAATSDHGAPDAGLPSPCPAATPTGGSGCAREGVVCEYGDDPRVWCRTFATCSSAHWSLATATCPSLPAAACPASRAAAEGQACDVMGAFCAYEGLSCECTNCIAYPVAHCVGAPTWQCDAPSTAASCPAARPRAGTSCATDGLACDYGCEPARGRRCNDGLWTPSDNPYGCPRSSRTAKRNIEYVTLPEAEALSREVLSTRLATYEYAEPLLAGQRRLGFILEDQPATSYAREPDRSSVDLYGYTSMLVATVQAQERRIRALEAAVAAMRRR